MGSTLMLAVAATAFVGTHFLLSHPLRRPLVSAIGEGSFLGLYSLVAAVTLVWAALAYRAAPATPLWWPVGDGLWALATLVVLLASILLVGSLIGNPAFPDPKAAVAIPAEPRGVFAITRHPMMWAFALWGFAHILVSPMTANAILAGAIVILALAGAALQDRKKERLQPASWPRWESATSFIPFAAVAAGKVRPGATMPGWTATLGGVALWLAATWAHIPLAGWEAGIWRWIGV
ncbi:MAG TPA: NnrU family protein [Allosphingosinicella sp.]|nr:NnrU family protein [Allosphingosinicella sp.]